MQKLLVPYSVKDLQDAIEKRFSFYHFEIVILPEIISSDIDAGLSCIDNDVCVASIAQIGQYINYVRLHSDEEVAILACELCADCRSANIEPLTRAAFSNAGINVPRIITLSNDVIVIETAKQENDRRYKADYTDSTCVGLTSNYPLLANSLFLKETKNHLEESGCKVAVPPLDIIVGQQKYLESSLQYFSNINIQNVVCIVAFGCLGGHVYSRGLLRELQKKYPTIAISILDYDYSASSINLINRLELVVQSMRD